MSVETGMKTRLILQNNIFIFLRMSSKMYLRCTDIAVFLITFSVILVFRVNYILA
jgi:hypothetical protein